jgi:DNA-binding MarR family transcriptional regulator
MEISQEHGELVNRFRDLSKVVRLTKQRWLHGRPAAPAGILGILMMIDEAGRETTGCHVKELASRAALDPSTVSRAVAALVAQGFVQRRADPSDGRASILAITDSGHRTLTEARAWFDDVLRRALAGWGPDEIQALDAALGRLTTDIEDSLDIHDDLEAAR